MVFLYSIFVALILSLPMSLSASLQQIEFDLGSYNDSKDVYKKKATLILGDSLDFYSQEHVVQSFVPALSEGNLTLENGKILNLKKFFLSSLDVMFKNPDGTLTIPAHPAKIVNEGWRCLLSKLYWAKDTVLDSQQALIQQTAALLQTFSMHKKMFMERDPVWGSAIPEKKGCIYCLIDVEKEIDSTPSTPSLRQSAGALSPTISIEGLNTYVTQAP